MLHLLPENFSLLTEQLLIPYFIVIPAYSFPTTPLFFLLIFFLIPMLTSHIFFQLSLLQEVLILLSTQDLLHLIMPLLHLHLHFILFFHFLFFSQYIPTGLPTGQPSSYPTGFTSITPYVWSTVQEPAASGIRYLYNTILSAAWSSSSTVVAVGFIQTANSGLILRSTTGGLSWTLLSVRKSVSFNCLFVHLFIFFLFVYSL